MVTMKVWGRRYSGQTLVQDGTLQSHPLYGFFGREDLEAKLVIVQLDFLHFSLQLLVLCLIFFVFHAGGDTSSVSSVFLPSGGGI